MKEIFIPRDIHNISSAEMSEIKILRIKDKKMMRHAMMRIISHVMMVYDERKRRIAEEYANEVARKRTKFDEMLENAGDKTLPMEEEEEEEGEEEKMEVDTAEEDVVKRKRKRRNRRSVKPDLAERFVEIFNEGKKEGGAFEGITRHLEGSRILNEALFENKFAEIENNCEIAKVTLPVGYYTASRFARKFNSKMSAEWGEWESRLSYSGENNRMCLKVGIGEVVQVENEALKEMLGIEKMEGVPSIVFNDNVDMVKEVEFLYSPNFSHDNQMVVVYCSIVDPSVLGGQELKYIRTVDISNREYRRGEIIHANFNDNQYFMCSKTMFPAIEIQLRTLTGRLLSIGTGNTAIVLDIRSVTRSRILSLLGRF